MDDFVRYAVQYCTISTDAARHASQGGHPRHIVRPVTHHSRPCRTRKLCHKASKSPKLPKMPRKIGKCSTYGGFAIPHPFWASARVSSPPKPFFAARRGVRDPAPRRTEQLVMRHSPPRRIRLSFRGRHTSHPAPHWSEQYGRTREYHYTDPEPPSSMRAEFQPPNIICQGAVYHIC